MKTETFEKDGYKILIKNGVAVVTDPATGLGGILSLDDVMKNNIEELLCGIGELLCEQK